MLILKGADDKTDKALKDNQMIFEHQEIVELPEFLSEHDNNVMLARLFDRRPLWEVRKDRVPSYKNTEWYTLGASLYLDLTKKEDWPAFCEKVEYFNKVLLAEFDNFWRLLLYRLGSETAEKYNFAWKLYPHFAMPGFHIFPPHLAATEFFGKKHQDLQWQMFSQMPDFALETAEHFSGTYALTLPKQGPHFLFGEDLEVGQTYKERAMYLHSGQFTHAIAPLVRPITELDWRITLQFHGFKHNDINYLYW